MDTKNKLCFFTRSLFLQAGWNYERMQNFGFLFTMLRCLKKLYADSGDFTKAVMRHSGVFNTQPFMSGFVVGCVCKMEETFRVEGDAGRKAEMENRIMNVKNGLASAFASIGDRLFWGRMLPLSTLLIAVLWIEAGFYGWFGAGGNADAGLVAAALFFPVFIYAAVSVYFRWKGIGYGYECASSDSCGLDFADWNKLARILSLSGFYFSSFTFAVLILLYWRANAGSAWGEILFKFVLILSSVLLSWIFVKLKKTFFSTAMAIVVFSFVGSLFMKFAGMEIVW